MESLFFWFSKFFWLVFSPDSLLLVILSIGTLFLFFNKIIWSKIVFGILLILMLLLSFFPIGEWLLHPLESKYLNNPNLEQVDGIIVLSGSEKPLHSVIWGQAVLGESSERNLAFIRLANNYPDAKLVFSGGSGNPFQQDFKAADVANRLFNEQGIDISKIIFEKDSRNTWENALFSKKLVDPYPNENWLLITSAWHMPRSIGVFCKVEWEVIPFPVDFYTQPGNQIRASWGFAKNLGILVTATKEWIGLLAYRLTNKSC